MKYVLIFIIYLSQAQYAQAAVELDLASALERVKGSTTSQKIREAEYQAALGESQILKSAFYPVFGVEGGYQKFDSSSEQLSGTYGNLFGEFKFDLGGSQYFKYRAARTSAQIAALTADLGQRSLRWSIETKFSRALYLQESIKLYLAAIEQNRSFAVMAQKKKASGLASQADVIEFDLSEAVLKSNLEDIKMEYGEALSDLRTTIGMSSEEPISLKGQLEHFHIAESLEHFKGRFRESNFGIQVASLNANVASDIKASSYSGFLPQLSLKATYGRRGVDEPEGPEKTYSIIARWELFSGFKDLGAYQKASALQAKADLEKSQAERRLPIQLEAEYKKFLSVQNKVDLESQNRARSKVYLDTVMGEYRRGVKNSADLKSASMQLLETSLRDLKYRFDGIKQKEVLQSLLGDTIKFEVYDTDHKVAQ